jgi:hypothetical protein
MNEKYLTYAEYLEINTAETPLTEDEFNRVLKAASQKLDEITNFFYHTKSLESDFPLRKTLVKMSLVKNIQFIQATGATSLLDISQMQASSISIGRTSISQGDKSITKAINEQYGIPFESYRLLVETGLLFSGVGIRC